MTGIKEEEEGCMCVCVCLWCVCQWEGGGGGGRWGCRRGCLSVLVDRAGDSQIQLIPSGCIHLSSTSDEKKRQKKRERDPPKVQYLVCINLCPIPQETLVIISISLSVRGAGSSPAFLWHVGLGNEKDKPWSLHTPSHRCDAGPRWLQWAWHHTGNSVCVFVCFFVENRPITPRVWLNIKTVTMFSPYVFSCKATWRCAWAWKDIYSWACWTIHLQSWMIVATYLFVLKKIKFT